MHHIRFFRPFTATAVAVLVLAMFPAIAMAAPADHFVLTGPAVATDGFGHSYTVTARDAGGFVDTGYTGTVNLKDGVTGVDTYTFVGGENGVHVFTPIMLTGAGAHVLTATDATIADGTLSVDVRAVGVATQLLVTMSATAKVNVAENITVTAVDDSGAPADASYTGTVTFTGASTVPAPHTFNGGNAGVYTSTGGVKFMSAGPQTINVTDAGSPPLTGTSGTITVAKGDQTVSFTSTNPVNGTVGGATYSAAATATSLLAAALTIDAGSSGVCTIDGGGVVTFTGVGTCRVNADQGGNDDWNAATQANQQITVKNAQTITFTSSVPGAALVGDNYTPTATADSGQAVTIAVDASSASVCSKPGAVVHMDSVGTCLLNFTQAGNGSYWAAPARTQSFGVGIGNTTTALGTSVTPSTYGDNVTFTATITYGGVLPTGTVQFKNGGVNLGTAQAVNGSAQATISTTALTATSHTITAIYSGDSNYAGSTSNDLTQVVNPATLTITASSTSIVHGAAVPTITPGYSGLKNSESAPATPPTCSVPTYTTTSPVGHYATGCSGAIDSNYSIGYVAGDVNVTQAGSTTTLGTSGSPTTYLGSVTFTATVTGPGAVATGTVQFKNGAVDLGTAVTLNGSGVATLTISTLSVADHSITAVYSGDANHATSTSSIVHQIVNGGAGTTTALGTSVTPSTYGDNVTFTATITYGGVLPTGTVQFKNGGVNLGTAQAVNGSAQATISTTALTATSHTITAIYSGDSNYAGSTSNDLTQVVNPATLTITASSTSIVHGAAVPTITPGYSGLKNSESAPATPPTCSVPTYTTTSPVGHYATGCSGAIDSNYSIGYVAGDVNVTQAGSTTTLGTSGSPTTYLGSVTFTATVTGPGAVATGTVQFKNGAVDLGTAVTLNGSGVATLTISTLSVADHSITAVYSGDANHATSTSSIVHQIVNGGAGTTTAVTSGGTPSVYATSVTFTATISFGAGVTPTGTVQFKDGVVDLGTPQAVNGSAQATYTTSALTVADHSITAVYSGDGNYATSTSAIYHQVVNGGATSTTTLATSGTPTAYGDSVTFTATVTGGGVTPTGTVQFKDGGVDLGTAQAVNGSGVATLTTTALAVADHPITAVYSGNGNYATSTSNTVHQIVSAGGLSTTALGTSGTPSIYGGSVTFTATVSGGAGTPTGTVQFKRGVVDIGTPVTLNGSGIAQITTTALSAADHSITAVYSGDASYATSTSSVLHQIVNQRTLTITASSAGMPYHGTVPAITPEYSGLQNGESAPATPPTCSTNATNTSPVGSGYTTSCTGAVDSNYEIGYVSGVFNVTKATPVLSFTSPAPSAAPGGPTYTPIVATTSDVVGDVVITIDASSSTVCSISAGVVSFLTLGTCTINADEPASTNWNAAAQKQQNVIVSAGAPTHLAVSAPGTATAGTPITVTVTALDAGDNTVPGYTGTVHFTSTDGAAVLPSDYTFVGGDGGVHTFTAAVTLTTVGGGMQTVTATDMATASINGTSEDIAMSAAATAKFAVTLGAGPVIPGASVTVTVVAQDAYGNTTTGYTGTVHLTTSDTAGTVAGDHAFVGGDAGSYVFAAGVTLNTPSTPGAPLTQRTVTATDTVTGSITGTSASIFCGYPASTYTAIQPARVLDTRPTGGGNTNMGLTGPFVVGTVRTFQVANAPYVGGGAAVAVPLGATAITGNLTITGQGTSTGLIALGPKVVPTATNATSEPTTINFVGSENRANNVTVGLTANGTLQAVYRGTAGRSVNVILDVTGYFTTSTSGSRLHTVTPGRVLDTRPTGGGVTHMDPGTSGVKKFANRVVRTVKVMNQPGVGWSTPQVPTGAKAVTANITVVNHSSAGFLSFGPTMVAYPTVSTLNANAGVITANGITVALDGSGNLQAVWAGANGSTADVLLDITGYFTDDGIGLSYYPVVPTRMMSSLAPVRGGVHLFATETPQTVTIGGQDQIPSDAGGISGNVTLINPSSGGFVYVGPVPIVRSGVSTVNGAVGRACANGFDVKLSSTTNGRIAVTWDGVANSTANITVDVTGYWK